MVKNQRNSATQNAFQRDESVAWSDWSWTEVGGRKIYLPHLWMGTEWDVLHHHAGESLSETKASDSFPVEKVPWH